MGRSSCRSSCRIVVPLCLALALVSCRDVPQGGYLDVSGRLFVFNYRIAVATYLVTLARLQPVPDGATLESRFENPAGGEPLMKVQKVWPNAEKITVESPPVHCVVADRPYKVTIRLLDGEGREMQSIETSVMSNVDQSLIPDRPLVIGPLYDPNPALAGHPDGKLPGDGFPCPGEAD